MANQAAAAPVDGAAVPHPVPAGLSGRTLTGKIARLPQSVRQMLNERLHDDVPYDEILSWLNPLPVVRQMMQAHFNGAPITKDNLSRWRHGGYACWFANVQTKEAIEFMAGACRGIDQSKRDALTGQIALVVTARMAVELRKFDELPEGPAKSEAWEKLVRSLVLLRRGEFYAGKLRLEQEKLAPKNPEARKAPACEQEYQERRRQIMGLGGPRWNNVTKQYEGEGAAEMTEKDEVQRMVVAELRRRKEAKAKEEAGLKKEEAAGGDSDGARPSSGAATPELPAGPENPGHPESANISASEDGRAPSPSAVTPELPAGPENPGHPESANISAPEDGRAPSPAQPQPNFLRDAKRPPTPQAIIAFRDPRTGALRHKLTTKPENHG